MILYAIKFANLKLINIKLSNNMLEIDYSINLEYYTF